MVNLHNMNSEQKVSVIYQQINIIHTDATEYLLPVHQDSWYPLIDYKCILNSIVRGEPFLKNPVAPVCLQYSIQTLTDHVWYS